jgi:hypothetical protein
MQAACLQNANTMAEAALKHDKASAEKRSLFTPVTHGRFFIVCCGRRKSSSAEKKSMHLRRWVRAGSRSIWAIARTLIISASALHYNCVAFVFAQLIIIAGAPRQVIKRVN